jgi:ethanolamine permease
VWLFLAIEQLPLAAEESVDPKKDMPRGIILGMATLMVSALMIMILNPSVPNVGTVKLATSNWPLLDGFQGIYGVESLFAKLLGLLAVVGLIASFHTIIFAQGRQIYSLSRAGYFPPALSLTHGTWKTPHMAMIIGSIVGVAIMLVLWFGLGTKEDGTPIGADKIGTIMLNMAVFGAMFSYILQAVSFILLRANQPNINRPYVSPLGIPGAVVTIVIAGVTLLYQLKDKNFSYGVLWVCVWFAIGLIYFAFVGRHRLILSPEEEFALAHKKS